MTKSKVVRRINPSVPIYLVILFNLCTQILFSQDAPIKVMTFNIRLNTTADGPNMWDNRKELVVAFCMSPDLIGMQEVLTSQLNYLSEKMYWFNYYGVGRDDGAFNGEAVPIFYNKERFSLLDKGTFWLSPTPKIPGSVGWDAALTRICSWVKLREKSSGFQFYFLNTHFDHMGDTARTESARIILDFINTETEALPVILTGDFNCSPQEDPYKVLTQKNGGLTDACPIAENPCSCSIGTFNGFGNESNPQRIDVIYYKGDWLSQSYEVLEIKDDEMFISDHWPVVATLERRQSPVGGQQSAISYFGDTTIIQTFTFDSISTRRAVFQFPEKGTRYEKILMYYTLKCDSLTPHDKYPCGEWDYTTYTRVYHRTGKLDSASFEEPFEVVEQFEIGRFITPYGKRLDLGLNGFTWVYDVTDYEPLLHGEVDLQAANGQELLDLKFLFIKGIPPRDVISVQNIWPEGSYTYKELADDAKLQATSLKLQPEAKSFMLRARISGHGHFGPLNCCEWDPKMHTYVVNGEKEFDWKVWRDCGMNPVHPQGGTWQFDRAGWCPGTFVDTYDFPITPYVKPGETVTVDYRIQPYDPDNGEEGGNYEMAMHLFEYSRPNYRLDLELTDVLAPSKRQEYRRMNPLSLNPVIRVRNNGTDTIRKFIVHYGIDGSDMSSYEWQGSLGFMQSAIIILPKPSWTRLTSSSTFNAEIKTVNDLEDELESNNVYLSEIEQPVILPSKFIIHVKTQGFGRGADNAYTITDEQGRIVSERQEFNDTTLYRDKIRLKPGAYNFTFTDKNEDGMIRHWWLFQEEPEKVGENGELKILDAKNNELMDLGYDFAEKRTLQFFVGEPE